MKVKQTLKFTCLFLLIVAVSVSANAQTKTITGIVLEDMTGSPITGVTIKVKEGPQTAITNTEGRFTMNIPTNGGTLEYSHIGYIAGSLKTLGDKLIEIRMKKTDVQMDEVVVVGYGTQTRADITGSVATVDMKKISDLPVSSIAEALRGQIPGLHVSGGSQRPGENATLSIRQQFGWSKDGSSQLPLIVIDDVIQLDPNTGLPTMDQFNMLDPSQVESITVLRDASAAIYGSRASQGAIIVKTKKGRVGPPKITYSGKFEKNDAVSFGKVMDAHDYGLFVNRFGRASAWNENSFFSEAELEEMKGLDYDWLKEAWKPGGAMQHSLTVSGGSERATYFAGASYYTQDPNLGNQEYNKWSFRTGVDVNVINGLKLSATVGANNASVEKSFTKISINDGAYNSGSEQTDYSVLLHMPRYIPWQYEVDGVMEYISPALGPHRVQRASVSQNNITGWNYFGLLNNGSFTRDDDQAFNTNFSLQYDVPFLKGLSLRTSYGLNYTTNNNEQSMLGLRLALATNTNQAEQHLYTESSEWYVGENNSRSTVRYSDVIGKVEQANFFVNYNNKFGLHNISAMASVEKGQQHYQKKFVIYDKPIMGAYNGSSPSAGELNTSNTYVYKTEGGNLAYLGRLSYDYDSKYLLQFLFRSDASTKFAPSNYWGFFPSVSAGWIISRENWFSERVEWVNFLKLRASIGKTGNDNLKAWRWMQTYGYTADKGLGFGRNGGVLGSALSPDATPNPDVTWDRSIKKNIGLDVEVLDGRLSLTYDRYWDHTTDMLMSLAGMPGVPISVGGAFAEQNYGAIKAWGQELSVTWRDRAGDFGYSIGVNFGTGDNKVTKYPPVAFDYPSKNQRQEGASTYFPAWGFSTWKGNEQGDGLLRTDADVDAYWNYLTELATKAGTTPSYLGITSKTGIRKGMLAYQDLGGELQEETKTIAGPNGQIKDNGEDFTKLVKNNRSYGFVANIGLSWRSFTLNAQIATSWGGYNRVDYVRQGTGSTQLFWSHESYLTNMYDTLDNVNGKWPNLAYYSENQHVSDFWQLSSFRSYLRHMVISYTLPRNISEKLKMDALRVSLAGQNLWDFYNPYPDKYRNMYDDPKSAYPTLRTFSVGINATF